jgi:hypothetical protein
MARALGGMTSVVSAERPPLAARERRGLARGLLEAALGGPPVVPLSERHPALTVADARRVRDATLAYRLAAGERLIGAKVSLPAASGRQPLTSGPALGWITDSMMLPATAVNPGELIHPRVEPRLALMLDRTVRKRMTTAGELTSPTTAERPSCSSAGASRRPRRAACAVCACPSRSTAPAPRRPTATSPARCPRSRQASGSPTR